MLSILHHDPSLIAISKPPGLLVHRSAIDRHETRNAMTLLRDQIGRPVFPVHRLDKPTSGVLLFALDSDTARLMGRLFAENHINKTYLAVVRGHTAAADTIDYPLVEEPDKLTDALAMPDKPAQSAVTHYERLAATELPYPVGRYPTCRYSLLKVTPATGRKHQIRRHMKHIFHPVIGDTTHGDGRHNRFFREQLDCPRLLLAATHLSFYHPHSGLPVEIHAPPDRTFNALLERLGWGYP